MADLDKCVERFNYDILCAKKYVDGAVNSLEQKIQSNDLFAKEEADKMKNSLSLFSLQMNEFLSGIPFVQDKSYKIDIKNSLKLFNEKVNNINDLLKDFFPYSFSHVFKHPLKPAFRELIHDLNYSDLFVGSDFKRRLKTDLTTVLSFGLFSVPHELAHAGANLIVGAENKEIVINKLFGGDLWHYFFPGIESKLMIPFIGGYVRGEGWNSAAGLEFSLLAPYVFTPLGIYMIQKGKQNKNLPLAGIGSGMVAAHFGGILGDFFSTGFVMMRTPYDLFHNYMQANGYSDASINMVTIAAAVSAFVVGSKTMSFTYRLSKASVNYVMSFFKK